MHESAHQQVLALMRSPEQFQAGDRRPLAQFLAVGDQGVGDWKVIRLMGQCKAVLVKAVLHGLQGETSEIQTQAPEQIDGGDAVLDRHAVTALQHHRLTAGQQHQRGERINRGCSGASVEGHPETERSGLPLSTGDHRTQGPVGIEHAGELLRLGAPDAMGNQEGTDLGRTRLSTQHQIEGIGCLLARHALAGVLATAHLAQQLLEAFATNGHRAGHGLQQFFLQCSGARDPAGVVVVTKRALRFRPLPLVGYRTQSPSNRPCRG